MGKTRPNEQSQPDKLVLRTFPSPRSHSPDQPALPFTHLQHTTFVRLPMRDHSSSSQVCHSDPSFFIARVEQRVVGRKGKAVKWM